MRSDARPADLQRSARCTVRGACYHPEMSEFPPVDEPHLALRVLMMPRDTNHQGTIFGGIILSHVDQAGYIEARRHGLHRWVTASIDRVDFKAPVSIGEVVEFRTRTIRLGRTSVTVQVVVDSERLDGSWARVTEAQITMVAVDAEGRAMPFRDAPQPPNAGGRRP
jgi:acyl-CoA thioesterase YciA